jgi:hypothetical protein
MAVLLLLAMALAAPTSVQPLATTTPTQQQQQQQQQQHWRRAAAAPAGATAALPLKQDDDAAASVDTDTSDVMAFYYLWYGNPETDGRYMHWNHSVLPHWTPAVNARYPNVGKPHDPPSRIHARFYPKRGCYSVADPATLSAQMYELRHAGVGTVVLSWWGRPGQSSGDSQGVVTDSRISGVLRAAAEAGVFVAWHMEPYEGRSAVRETAHFPRETKNPRSFPKTESGQV